MAMKGTNNSAKGADFGRGTKSMPGKDPTSVFESDAPKVGEDSGKADITDKTS